MSEREQIVSRLSDLQAKQEAATGWGAAVGAREEEIRSLESRLLRIDSMTAGNQPSSSGSKSAFDICVMIVEEECYLDAPPAEGDNYERAMHEVGLAIRDRIRCAQQEASGAAQPPMPFLCPCCGARGTTDGKASTVPSTTRDTPRAPLNAIQFITLLEILEECAEHVTPELEARIKNVLSYHTDHDTVSSLPPAMRETGGPRS